MRRIVAAALAVALVGCGGDGGGSTGPGETRVAGSYTLRTVNGATLPFTVLESPGYRLEVTGGQMTFATDGSCTDQLTYRETDGATVLTSTDGEACTYSQVGTGVTLSGVESGATISGVVAGSQITFAVDGVTLVYRK